MSLNVLLIEDSRDLAQTIFDYFQSKGHRMDLAWDGITGLHLAASNAYDVAILDWMLPGADGITVCKRLRETGNTLPILMLTARDTLQDKVAGLEAGADDYLVKPFALRELEARLLALTRRSHLREATSTLCVGNLSFDRLTLQAQRGKRKISLPPISLKILAILMRESPRVLPRGELERLVWGESPPDSDALRAHMHILRHAVDGPDEAPLVRTLRGIGYQLAE